MPLWSVTYERVVAAATEEEAIDLAAEDETSGTWSVRMIAQQSLSEAFGLPPEDDFMISVEIGA